jgi:hypothetical protein
MKNPEHAYACVLLMLCLLVLGCSEDSNEAAEGPALQVSPTSLDFGLETQEMTLTVRNTGTGRLGWTAENDEDWIRINPGEGGLEPGGEMGLRVDVQRAGLSSGTHSATIVLRTNGGDREVAIALEISPAVLRIEPAVIDFAETLYEATVRVHNLGGGALTWTIEPDEPWVSAEPAAGETTGIQNIRLRIDRSELAPGTHTSGLQVRSNGGSGSVSVSLVVPSRSPFYLRPDGTLSTETNPPDKLYQKRLSGGETEWRCGLDPNRITGRDYGISIQAASYEETDLQVSLLLAQFETEIPLVSTLFTIQGSTLLPYEDVLTGPDPATLPSAGELVLRIGSAKTVWVGMGASEEKSSFVMIPILE